MKKLLSLPPNLVDCFHDIEKTDRAEWFSTSDPNEKARFVEMDLSATGLEMSKS